MNEKKKNIMIAGVTPLLFIEGLRILIPFVYAIIDDRSMMEILSGQYLGRPDAHAIFLQYWYSLVLTWLYHISRQIDWYALGFLAAQWGCMGLILYRILRNEEDRKEKNIKVLLALLIFLTVGIKTLTQITFTTTAAVLGSTVLYWYATVDEIRKKDLMILLLLSFLTFQIRIEIFFMILPVEMIFWGIRMWRNKNRKIARAEWYFPLLLAVVFVVGLAGNQIGYGDSKWRAYNTYNQYRSDVYDYPDYTFPPYEEAEDLYRAAGIHTKAQARTLMNYNYTADDEITPDFFRQYIQTYQQMYKTGGSHLEKIAESLKTYIKGLLTARFHLVQSLGMLLLGWLILLSAARKHWIQTLELVAVTGIQVVLWVYLLYKGRVPERVIYSMNLLLIVIVMIVCRESNLWNQWKKGKVIVILLLLSFNLLYGMHIRTQNLESYKRNESVESLKEYCEEHTENFYFNDVTTMAFTTCNVKLWSPKVYTMNYMSLGDWISFSPLWKEKLKQKGITSVRKALYGMDNVYLICTFDKGLEYLSSLYENVTCTEKDHVGMFHIYQISEKEEN